jgi:hypothetical protein
LIVQSPVSESDLMVNPTTPMWLKDSLSAVRRAPSADPQATRAFAHKRPSLPLLNARTTKVVSMIMTLAFRGQRKSPSSCERGNRVILHVPHLDVTAIDALKFMLFGD